MKLSIAAGVCAAINMLSCSAHPDVFAMPASLAGMNYKMMAKRDDSSGDYYQCDAKKAPFGCEAVQCDAGFTGQCDGGGGVCICQNDIPCPGGTADCVAQLDTLGCIYPGADATCSPGENPKCYCKGTNPSAVCDYGGYDPSRSYYDSKGRLCCAKICAPNDQDCAERLKKLFAEKPDCPYS